MPSGTWILDSKAEKGTGCECDRYGMLVRWHDNLPIGIRGLRGRGVLFMNCRGKGKLPPFSVVDFRFGKCRGLVDILVKVFHLPAHPCA